MAFDEVHHKPMLHVHCQSKFRCNRMTFHHLHGVAVQDGGGGELHLVKSEIFA